MGNEVKTARNYLQDDEVSLREIVMKLREFIGEVARNWKVVLYFIVPIIVLMLIRAFVTPKEYEAELTFMVNEDEGSKLGGVATILENIGLAPTTTNSEYNLDKILELMRSHRIISRSLIQRTKLKDEEDYFANHLIKVYNLHKEWKKEKPELATFLFTHDSIRNFNRQENTAMKIVSKKLLGDNNSPAMLSSSISENSGIMSMKLTTRSEKLSIDLLKTIYQNLSKFYIDQTTSKQRDTYEKIKHQTDSIRVELASTERELATFLDQHQNLIPQRAQLRKEQLEEERPTLFYARWQLA